MRCAGEAVISSYPIFATTLIVERIGSMILIPARMPLLARWKWLERESHARPSEPGGTQISAACRRQAPEERSGRPPQIKSVGDHNEASQLIQLHTGFAEQIIRILSISQLDQNASLAEIRLPLRIETRNAALVAARAISQPKIVVMWLPKFRLDRGYLPTSLISSICRSMRVAKVVFSLTRAALALLPEIMAVSVSRAQASASDLRRNDSKAAARGGAPVRATVRKAAC